MPRREPKLPFDSGANRAFPRADAEGVFVGQFIEPSIATVRAKHPLVAKGPEAIGSKGLSDRRVAVDTDDADCSISVDIGSGHPSSGRVICHAIRVKTVGPPTPILSPFRAPG